MESIEDKKHNLASVRSAVFSIHLSSFSMHYNYYQDGTLSTKHVMRYVQLIAHSHSFEDYQ